MRRLLARSVALLSALVVFTLATVFATAQNPPVSRESGAPATSTPAPSRPSAPIEGAPAVVLARGRAVYERSNCSLCHSIGGSGNTNAPLDGVAARLTREQIRRWIVAPREMDPAVRKPSFDLPDDDLAALVEYVVSAGSPTAR